MRDSAAYLAHLQALLPQGPAWPRDEESTLTGLLRAWADGLARADARALALLEEADPLTTLEMLADWERAVGLPDPCVPISDSTLERQIAIARRIAGLGGQSRAFFVELAALLGIEVEIVEFRPFTAGTGAGQPVHGEAWSHAFMVRALPASEAEGPGIEVRSVHFTAGSKAGDPLRIFSVSQLECVIRRARPAHTEVIFAYPEDPEPELWFDFTGEA